MSPVLESEKNTQQKKPAELENRAKSGNVSNRKSKTSC